MKNYICPRCGMQKTREFAPGCVDCKVWMIEKPYNLDMLCLDLLKELDQTQSENNKMIILRRFVGNAYETAKEMGKKEALSVNAVFKKVDTPNPPPLGDDLVIWEEPPYSGT